MSTLVTVPEIGLHPDVPEPEYRRWPGASQSLLKILRDKSPAHAKYAMDNPTEPTEPQRIGAATHTAVLQPDLFERAYKRGPEGDGRTKAVKEAREELEAAFPHATILKPADYDLVVAIRDAIARHPVACALLEHEAERSAIWKDPATGVLCKARFDDIARSVGAITDLKTTTDASEAAFTRSIYTFGYYIQAAHYIAGARALGIDVEHFAIIAVEKEPPFGVAVYRVRDDAIFAGAEELKPLLERFAACERTGVWPAYPAEAVDISLPPWAWRQVDERLGRA